MTPSANFNPQFFVLMHGDEIKAGDEYYNPINNAWLPVEKDFIGSEFDCDESKPVRRRNPKFIATQRVEGEKTKP